jgi:hypothetical protein
VDIKVEYTPQAIHPILVHDIARVLRFPPHRARECGALVSGGGRVRVHFIRGGQVLPDDSASPGIVIKVSNC